MPGEMGRISWGIYYVAYIFMDLRSVAPIMELVQYQVCKAAKVAIIIEQCTDGWQARTGIVYRVGIFVVAVS
jgi:hypothetical protein